MHDSTIILLLTKLLPIFLYPIGLGLALLALGLVLAWRGARRLAFVLTSCVVAGLWLASSPIFAEWSLGLLERQHPPIAIEDLPAAEVAIVLGGAVSGPIPPRKTLDLLEAADRVLHASRLYRAGKVRRVLVVGGNLPWSPGVAPEAELIRDLLIEWGVPATAIDLGAKSRNTYENAEEARAIFDRKPFGSARHFRGAYAPCARHLSSGRTARHASYDGCRGCRTGLLVASALSPGRWRA